jgi:hypothetical protein
MAIVRRCRGRCSTPRRCLEHLWFDVMFRGSRYRIAANDFAVPRMEPGKQRTIQSMEEARHWDSSSARSKPDEIRGGRAHCERRLTSRRRASRSSSTRTWTDASSPQACGASDRSRVEWRR